MRQGNNSRRSRGRGNGRRQPRGNHVDSHGPEVRVRGTNQQVYDKYLALARDAMASGDRISAENMYQHAEHYFRGLVATQENNEQRNDNRDGPRSRHSRSANGQTRDASNGQERPKTNENAEASATDNEVTDPSVEVEVILEHPVTEKEAPEENQDEGKVQGASSQAGPESEEQLEQVTV